MDFLSLLGVVLAFVAILGGNLLEGGALSSLFNAPAAVIVIGGTLAATILQTSWPTLKRASAQFRWVFVPPGISIEDGIGKVIDWSVKARKQGLLGLE
jgi:chemotaxis protein MotA